MNENKSFDEIMVDMKEVIDDVYIALGLDLTPAIQNLLIDFENLGLDIISSYMDGIISYRLKPIHVQMILLVVMMLLVILFGGNF